MHFTIDRSKWVCGIREMRRGRGRTKLLNTIGFMCCLGQIGRQLGASDDSLKHVGTPALADEYALFNGVLTVDDLNSTLSCEAMAINDGWFTDEEREKRLTELFAAYGHEITFVNEYVSPLIED